MSAVQCIPLGYMQTCFKTKNGTPRQGAVIPDSKGVLTVDKSVFTNPEHSLEGLTKYSYVWILFSFHLNENKGVKAKVRPPRLDGVKLGVFATRSPHRPNPIGLTLAKLEKVEQASVFVSGVDIVDGTPILDIKPYIPQYDVPTKDTQCGKDTLGDTIESGSPLLQPSLVKAGESAVADPSLLSCCDPGLKVVFTPRAEKGFENLSTAPIGGHNSPLKLLSNPEELKRAIVDVLKADPRSTYRRNKCSDRLYYFTLDQCHITAWFDHSTTPVTAEVLRVIPQQIDGASFTA